ncbi:MAG: ligase, partial [Bacteroidetes bacterium]|nr:ligase [Bacteroidota bacterium]
MSVAKLNKKKGSSLSAGKKAKAAKKNKSADVQLNPAQLLKKAPTSAIPLKLKPMLATLVDKPVNQEGWIYEVKWDGYRAIAFSKKGKVDLKSRNDKFFNDKFYPVKKAIENWGVNAVLDGEIIVADESGISNFGKLQNWRSEADGELLFYVFDILWYNNKDLTQLTLLERRSILKSLIPKDSIIRLSDDFNESAVDFFEKAKAMGLEGIIAKQAGSTYEAGDRSKSWLKIKANKRQEMVIGGYTNNDDSNKPFSSLVV